MVVDSSIWLEILIQGPHAKKCLQAIHQQRLKVPALVLFEIYKKLKMAVSEDVALESIASLSKHEVLDLTREVALLAADISLEHELPMADAIVLAHARVLDETLLTLDNDFVRIPAVKVIR